MKMCFLDIDGILNSGEDHENLKELKQRKNFIPSVSRKGDWVERTKLEMLQKFVKETGVLIQVVSAWTVTHTLDDIRKTLGLYNEILTIERNKNYYPNYGSRGSIVYNTVNNSGISGFVTLDDSWHVEYGDNSEQFHCVKICGRKGLEPYHLEEAKEWLTKTPKFYE